MTTATLHLPASTPPRIVVFSGGSAANNLVDVFGKVAEERKSALSYVIPISDNGGSSSELIRVFGGPGIGDVRSRLVRLIPEDVDGNEPEKAAIKTFFNHRLSPAPQDARIEWLDIVEARHALWRDISPPKRELIRSFLNTINLEIVKRARPSSVFSLQSASVGNLFLTGARLFTGSFESAIYLLGAITGLPRNVEVIPAINSNFSHHISAGLQDGTVITGQNAISHPSIPIAVPESPLATTRRLSKEISDHDRVEDANLPGSLPSLRTQNIEFHKDLTNDLPSRIERIWYINPYGQEIRPAPNPRVMDAVGEANCVIYSIGSLYTSIVPCLVLRDIGAALAATRIRFKILILNGSIDRETGPESAPYGAKDFIAAIAGACWSSRGRPGKPDEKTYRDLVTHVIHLQGEGTPRVEKDELKVLGIETVRIYGRRGKGGVIYDGVALAQTLDAIIGRRDPRADRSRRNTLEH
ncbi:hypothetical protein PVAG01_04976 [Phlyctema vagabunda]|uniref:Uncharacterized protein n=1 Tax=Phlyctema vagabunda TaxID=108571 RepID=A0ABR4PIT2_9HELO